MSVFESLVSKLANHLADHYGFVKTEDKLVKQLSVNDFLISDRTIREVMEGRAYRGANPYVTLESLIIENYIGENIMDKALYDAPLTDEEKAYFMGEDEEDEDDAYFGYTEIESWAAEQDITIDRDELKRFVAAKMCA